MDLSALPIGKNPPHEVNVVVEVPVGGEPIKYEMHKASGALMVDRFLYTSMRYPGNYGFIPHTLSDDGDPCDVVIANQRGLLPGSVIAVRPVGVLHMQDEAGGDEKILAVPVPEAHAPLRACAQLHRPAGHHRQADAALLRALQGPGARQVGQGAGLGRCGRGPRT